MSTVFTRTFLYFDYIFLNLNFAQPYNRDFVFIY